MLFLQFLGVAAGVVVVVVAVGDVPVAEGVVVVAGVLVVGAVAAAVGVGAVVRSSISRSSSSGMCLYL